MEPSRCDTLDFCNSRNAHRVFPKSKSKWERLNPFRHFPWGYEGYKQDIEAQPERRSKSRRFNVERTRRIHIKFGKKFDIRIMDIKIIRPRIPFTLSNQLLRTFMASWANILILCIPIGFVLRVLKGNSVETFVFNYISAIPLWFMIDFAFEEIQKRIGLTASDILNIFTTNTVQIISGIQLLVAGQVSVLQTSLIGGILSNILVLLGLSILFGGTKTPEQSFNRTGAQGASSLLSIAATSLLIPTAIRQLHQSTNPNIVLQSRGVAFVLLFIYIAFTLCQLKTHREMYMDKKNPRHQLEGEEHGAEIVDAHLHGGVALFTFTACIVLLYFVLDAVVSSIDTLTQQTSLTPTFVGLILLPIPNCDFAPISLAVEDRLEQTMKYTVGRSIQTALLVEPMVILLAWWMHVSGVTLAFDGFQVVSLFTTILLLNFLVIDAKVHWIHGILLLADWLLIAIAAYFVIPQVSN